MTTIPETPAAAAPSAATGAGLVTRFDEWLARLGDHLNPILVKETRQALKSQQFSLTFVTLLSACWLWSIFGVAYQGPSIRYEAAGGAMFAGYLLVLAFPLLVMVPYGAFRSLAAEGEERTFELVAITTLRPGQVIAGKLGSACVQMLIYLSAITPCLAFTYLLRGIDVLSILWYLAMASLYSLALSMLSLVVATLARQRHWQTVLSVLLILGLFGVFWWFALMTGSMLWMLSIEAVAFWGLAAFVATVYASYFALFFTVAAARLAFPGSNRSTAPRAVLVLQGAILMGYLAWLLRGPYIYNSEVPCVLLLWAGLQWYVAGAFLVAESPELSQRVKRGLPQSLAGRAFFAWLQPGPATGLMLAVASMAGLVLAALIVIATLKVPVPLAAGTTTPLSSVLDTVALVGLLIVSYLAIYLGLGRLIVGFWRRFGAITPIVPVLVQVLLVHVGCGIPLLIYFRSAALRRDGYSVLQATNFVWTLYEAIQDRLLPLDRQLVMLLVPAAAAIVLLLNLPAIVREISQAPLAPPPRVLADEQSRLARPEEPQSPWQR